MDGFGSTDPRQMPPWFFRGAVKIDHATARRANIAAQDYTVAPRHWYIDAHFRCGKCGVEYLWSAREQRTWFEVYRFYVDSQPTLCRRCRARQRHAFRLRQDYDTLVAAARAGGTPEQKRQIVQIVDELEAYWQQVPDRLRETRELFERQAGDEGWKNKRA